MSQQTHQCQNCGATEWTDTDGQQGRLCTECGYTEGETVTGPDLDLTDGTSSRPPWANSGRTVGSSDDSGHDGDVSTDWLPDGVVDEELNEKEREIVKTYVQYPDPDPSIQTVTELTPHAKHTVQRTLTRYVFDNEYSELGTKRQLAIDIMACYPELSSGAIAAQAPISHSHVSNTQYRYPDLIEQRRTEIDSVKESEAYQELVGDETDPEQQDNVTNVSPERIGELYYGQSMCLEEVADELDVSEAVARGHLSHIDADDCDSVEADADTTVETTMDANATVEADADTTVEADGGTTADDDGLQITLDRDQVEAIMDGELPDDLEAEVRDAVLERALA